MSEVPPEEPPIEATDYFVNYWKPESTEEINKLLKAYITELEETNYGMYPMQVPKWLELDAVAEDSQPAFVKTEQEVEWEQSGIYRQIPIKKDYVFGPGSKGFGYYHLLTKHAWEIINHRVAIMKAPGTDVTKWVTGRAKEMLTADDRKSLDQVSALCYCRAHSPGGVMESGERPEPKVVDSVGDSTDYFVNYWKPDNTEEINKMLKAYIPELEEAQHGMYPMQVPKWLELDGVALDSQPAFVKWDGEEVEWQQSGIYHKIPIKKDYVFGTGPKGWGYYHLLTKHAWELLNHRVAIMKAPGTDVTRWLTGRANEMLSSEDHRNLDDISALFYCRAHSPAGLMESGERPRDKVVDSVGDSTDHFVNYWKPTSTEEINKLLKEYLTELKEAKYGMYPMQVPKWLELDGTSEDSEPAFVKTDEEVEWQQSGIYEKIPIKTNYVFGPGPKGWGYYHLLTKHAWELINHRVAIMKAPGTDVTRWLKGHAKEMLSSEDHKNLDQVSALCYCRAHSPSGLMESGERPEEVVADSVGDSVSAYIQIWKPTDMAEINEQMKKFIPELDQSELGAYPMKVKWTALGEMVDDKAPSFIPSETEVKWDSSGIYASVAVKPDYVFGTGPKGYGWYHLKTKHSWELLTHRTALMKAPGTDVKKFFTLKWKEMLSSRDRKHLDGVNALLYCRSHCPDGVNEAPFTEKEFTLGTWMTKGTA